MTTQVALVNTTRLPLFEVSPEGWIVPMDLTLTQLAMEEVQASRQKGDSMFVGTNLVSVQVSWAGKDRAKEIHGEASLSDGMLVENEETIVSSGNASLDEKQFPKRYLIRTLTRPGDRKTRPLRFLSQDI
jgi:hypothetical protein